MLRYVLGMLACASLSAQTPQEMYLARCSGCHGASGEGSRGPALRASTLQHAKDAQSLMALLRRGIPGTEMPALPEEVVPDEALRRLAVYVLGLGASGKEAIAEIAPGGAALFRVKGKCLACHRVNGAGGASGPDLIDIGRTRQPEWLRQAVLEPQKALYDS